MPILHHSATLDWVIFGGFLLLLFVLLAAAEALQRRNILTGETSRKIVHMLTGLAVLLSPFLFQTLLPLLILAVLFTVLNAVALKFGRFSGIHATGRKTYGTVFYPLAFFVLLLLFWRRETLALLVGMSLLAIADVCAALVGEQAKSPLRLPLPGDRKSLQGSLAMFVSSALLVFIGFAWAGPILGFHPETSRVIFAVIGIALLATAGEAVSWHGSDNLSVPLLGGFLTYFYVNASDAAIVQFFVGELLALAVTAISYRVKFLELSGALATFVLGSFVFGLGGWKFSLPLLAFFVLSSMLSRLGAARKRAANKNFQKGHRRDLGQVLANGGIPGLLVVLWYLAPQPVWYFLFLGAVAAVTADTWATEIGLLSRRPPRLITSLKIVASGTSGAISTLGLFGAALGAGTIALLGWALQSVSPAHRFGLIGVVLITAAGVLAHLFDSLLGATIQTQRVCLTCRKVSEKKGECCGAERQPHSGWRWVDNDMVNGICALSGVLAVFLGMPMLKILA
ncbi:DUF92 domain-containing protein [candidate division KSB1 bacterium]|nr:MAG: DUF92 domain-containing protein [candidate division KSB1 bacterium]MCE7945436.1 DUF92 domain-containing protein [Chlorobi bacterium CHB1]MDL1877630.1 DUF92 domain-containing protein [Cytophagia bacterium CHB2]